MGANDRLDELFFSRALERGLLRPAQVTGLRGELNLRRADDPDLCAHELAVERGYLTVEAALALLDASAGDTIEDLRARLEEPSLGTEPAFSEENLVPEALDSEPAQSGYPYTQGRDTERLARVPAAQAFADHSDELGADEIGSLDDESSFGEVPRLVEPVAPSYAVPDSAEDSVLEMELPPPAAQSGDSLFEEHEQKHVPVLDSEPLIVGEKTPSVLAPTGFETEGPSDTLLEVGTATPPADPSRTEPGYREMLQRAQPGASRKSGDTVTGEEDARPAPPQFALRGSKGANVDFAAFGGDDEPARPEELSGAMQDSAVGEVMEQADDGYFGPPADLTRTPDEVLHESIAPPPPSGNTLFTAEPLPAGAAPSGDTLFDSESLKVPVGGAGEPEDFAATKAPAARERGPVSEVNDNSDVDVSVTLPGDNPTGSTVFDDSNVSAEEITGETSEVTTGSKTQFATGEGARAGLARTDSKVGVESDITGEEMTLADLRAKMGIGEGVRISGEAKNTLGRLKSGGNRKRYSVIREIARGGMGKVLEVEDTDLRRSVALKVLRKEMLDRKDLVERFLEESQITGQLEHPNIVPVHEIGVDGRGNLYFTMKLVEGEDLSSILKRLRKNDPGAVGTFPLNRLVDIFLKVCEGVNFAHSRGVIHRDLKPANIMVGRFGEVQIMDWGVAKLVGRKEETADRVVQTDRQDDDALRTMVGSILGTPSYMSPEQARGEVNTMGPTSDIFALGVILYELLAMKTPWTAETSAQVLVQVKELNPEPPSKRAPERKVPPELEALAMKCISKLPHQRVQSVTDLIENLRSWQEGRTLAAVEYSMTQLIGKWIARHKVGVITSILVLAALIGGVSITYQQLKQGEIDTANKRVEDGRKLVAEGKAALEAGNLDEAERQATEAQKLLGLARDVLKDENTKNAETEALIVGSTAASKRKELAEARLKEQRDAEKRKELDAALAEANKLLNDARDLDKAADVIKANEAFNDAKSAFIKVQSFDADHSGAKLALNEIGEWLKNYDARKQFEASMATLRGLVDEAGKKLTVARGLPAESYDDASRQLVETIGVCDRATSVAVVSPDADQLRDRARLTKAEAALNFAQRALDSGRYEVSDLMLNTAAGTGMMSTQVKATREVLQKKVEEQSRFRRLVVDAEKALTAKEWVLAQARLQAALAEARTSAFATDQDRAELDKNLQLARLEELRLKDQLAKTSEDLQRCLAAYETLIPGLTAADYVTRAQTYRDELRTRLGAVLVSEADGAEDRVAVDLLERALGFLTDKGQISEINTRLTEIRLRVALTQVSDRYVLLPRGSFVVGSNREGDGNAQRTVEQPEFLFMDKYLVTNEEFKKFVDDGGYTRTELWPEEALAFLPRMVDTSGKHGPAGWAEGAFDPSLARVPVTGISWFEAAAFARWAGKRLPTPEEWEIAAGAPALADSTAPSDYPFGAREKAPAAGVLEPREVGTTEWDACPLGLRDMGSNVSEWTAACTNGEGIVKGAEPGLRPELFFRYARRAKNSVALLAERGPGRGFRCIRKFSLTDTKDAKDGNGSDG